MPCGSQFRVAGKAGLGVKKLLEEAMECDLSNVDIISLVEVVVRLYRELPWAMTEEERRRNAAVVEFCTDYSALYQPLHSNFKVNGTTGKSSFSPVHPL